MGPVVALQLAVGGLAVCQVLSFALYLLLLRALVRTAVRPLERRTHIHALLLEMVVQRCQEAHNG